MKINTLVQKLDSFEKKEESILVQISETLSKRDKKNGERPKRMLNMLEKITEGVSISKEANQIIRESLEEIENKIVMRKEGISLGYFPGIQSNILLFKFLSEAKNLDTSSSFVIKELYEEVKTSLVAGSWYIIENGEINLYPSGKTAIIEWCKKTTITLNENRFFLRVKLLKEDQLETKAEKMLANETVVHDIREFHAF